MKFLCKDCFNLFNYFFVIVFVKIDVVLRVGFFWDDFIRVVKVYLSYCVLFWCIIFNCFIYIIVFCWYDLIFVKFMLDYYFKELWKLGLLEKLFLM